MKGGGGGGELRVEGGGGKVRRWMAGKCGKIEKNT